MIPRQRDISYEMRLRECDLTTLETRTLRVNHIDEFQILNSYEIILFSVKEDSSLKYMNVY